MPSYFVRITHAYAIAAPIIYAWSLRCDSMLVYEHSQATGTAKGQTHIHIIIVNTNVDKKQLRNIATATGVPSKGNENMSFKAYDGSNKPITYMSKGKIDPVYSKGYDGSAVEAAKAEWVEPSEYVKENPWQKLYEEYAIYAPTPRKIQYDEWLRSDEVFPTYDNFTPMVAHAKTWLSKKLNNTWCPQYGNMLKCLVYTYCWRNGVTIPANWKSQ